MEAWKLSSAGGNDGLRHLAGTGHRRAMADDVGRPCVQPGFHPQHVDRLAAYWAEALGGSQHVFRVLW
jgi:hemoglobin